MATPYCLSVMLTSTFALSEVSLLEQWLLSRCHGADTSRCLILVPTASCFIPYKAKVTPGEWAPPDSYDFIVSLTETSVAEGGKQQFPGGEGQDMSSGLSKVTIASRSSRRISCHA